MRYYYEGEIVKIKSARELGLDKLKDGEECIINGWSISRDFIKHCGKKYTVEYCCRGAYAMKEFEGLGVWITFPVSSVKRKCLTKRSFVVPRIKRVKTKISPFKYYVGTKVNGYDWCYTFGDALRFWLWHCGVPPKIAFGWFKKKRK